MSRILINSTSLPPTPLADCIKSRVTGTLDGIRTGLVARSVSAARFGSGTSLPGLRAPSFRFFVVSYSTFFVFESESVFVFYEPRLALLFNVRAAVSNTAWAAPPLEVEGYKSPTFQKWGYRGVQTATQGGTRQGILTSF